MLAVHRHLFRCGRTLFSAKLKNPILINGAIGKNLIARRAVIDSTSRLEVDSNVVPRVRKGVGIWFLSVAGATFVTVVFGGVTRLTRSGLSMVDWRFFKEFPPRNEEKWLEEFEMYKKYPEYQLANHGMTLEEFKKIWYMEYSHRSIARLTGLIGFLPFFYFWIRNELPVAIVLKALTLNSLILGQGFLGWYMVKSGLDHETAIKYSHPHVSHYRLAAHLGLALTVFSLSIRNGLHYLLKPDKVNFDKRREGLFNIFFSFLIQVMVTGAHSFLRRSLVGISGLVFLTAVSGAFVAGLDAGLVYNSFPKMADRWFPSDYFAKFPFYRNFLENPSATQFNHRLLAELSVASALGVWLFTRKMILPPRAKLAIRCFAIVACTQLSLGVATLLLYVPKPLAALHQAGSLGLLSSVLWAVHETKLLRFVPK
ncbi:heme A synthase COX15 isoform X1 [Brevipalpus obovatus]|uniref:heme A synthase COX15 isoform X1 n=1 Tax=Brevipalpus obovatus TaxID=246614 RepID=UPI003D9F6675